MKRVTAAVIVENGRLLLTRRGPEQKLAGLWELPGGKIEPGETPQECLERELLEELAMTSSAGDTVARTIFHYDHGSFEILALAVERQSDYTLSVHDDAMWVTRDALGSLDLAPADIDLIAALAVLGIW